MRQKSSALSEQLEQERRQLSQATEDNEKLKAKVSELELNLGTEKTTLRTTQEKLRKVVNKCKSDKSQIDELNKSLQESGLNF